MRASEKKGVICILCSCGGAYLSYVIFGSFFLVHMGSLMGERFSAFVSLFYAATIGAVIFVLMMYFWKIPDQKPPRSTRRSARVKRFKL